MLSLLLWAAILPAPIGQPNPSDVAHYVIGDCRTPADGSVVVCGSRKTDSPYRLTPDARDPGFDVNGSVDSVLRERNKLMEGGAAGTGSCSNIGAGGWTGCMTKGWEVANQQRGYRPAGRFKK